MIRLDLSYFYRLSLTFDALKRLEPDDKIEGVWLTLHEAMNVIRGLYAPGPLRSCFKSSFGSAGALYAELQAQTARDWGETLTRDDMGRILHHLTEFEIILRSELAVADAYYVVEKRGYSTEKLITQGEALFPSDLPLKVPEAVEDLRESTKALAFELATASGFHTLRAVEAVLRRYWKATTGNRPKPRARNLGVYLNALRQLGCGDPKVIAALQQLKDLHRNVIFHPEDSLTTDEAVSLLGIAHSVIEAMLAELPLQNDVAPAADAAATTEETKTIDEVVADMIRSGALNLGKD